MKKGLAFLFFIISYNVFGQLEQTSRFEYEVKPSENIFEIISADSLGLFLFRDEREFEKRNKIWTLIYLDTLLEKVWENKLFINDRFIWEGYEVQGKNLFLLFRQGEINKSDLYVVKVGMDDSSVETYDIKNEIAFELTHFSVCSTSILMGGYVDYRPTLMIYDLQEEKIKVIPGFYIKNAKLIDVTVNVNNTFNVLILNQKGSNEYLELKVYDSEGNVLAEDIFGIPEDKRVISGLTSRLKNESLIVTGIFGSSKTKLAEGIFWAKTDLSKNDPVKFIPLSELSSIYNYLPEKRRVKMVKKAERKREKNKFFEKEFMIIHRLLEKEGLFYLSMEMFDPYTVRSNQVASPYNSPVTDPYGFSRAYSTIPNIYDPNEFSRINYLQSIVASFNEDGLLLWDSTFVFKDKKTDKLEQVADVIVKDEKVGIAYKNEKKIYWKVVGVKDTVQNIMLPNNSDLLRKEWNDEGGVRNWYEGAFYIWGYQSIKRREGDDKNNIFMFYINKLELLPD